MIFSFVIRYLFGGGLERVFPDDFCLGSSFLSFRKRSARTCYCIVQGPISVKIKFSNFTIFYNEPFNISITISDSVIISIFSANRKSVA